MRKNALPAVVSIVSLLVTLAFVWFPDDYHRVVELFAIVLVIIGSIYLGFAFKDDNRKHWITEISAASVFILAAAFGLWWNPWLIAISLIAHGFWDLFHHRTQYTIGVPTDYAPFCAIYDWAAGSYFATYLLTTSS